MSVHKRHPRGRRANARRRIQLETLESRKLLAASVLEMPDGMANHEASPIALAASAQTDSAQDGPIVSFIVNGQNTSDYDAVGIVNGGCTGTLISPTHVLTAAHCVEDGGGGFIGNRDGTFTVNGETYRTTKVTVHPKYNTNDFGAGFDLAIMELDRPVVGVTPMDINRTAPQIGQTLTLVGFGEAGTTSQPDYGFGVKNVGTTPIDAITNEHISWTLDNSNEAATAPGDSGGPAFIEVDGKLVVAGVTSGGSGDAHSIGAESFDTRVDTLASWIDAQVGGTTPTDPPVDPPVDPPSDPPTDPPTDPPADPGGNGSYAEELARDELAAYDEDGNGELSMAELTNEFLDYGLTEMEASDTAQYLIEDFDVDGNGSLSLSELITSWGGGIDDPGDPVDPVDPGNPSPDPGGPDPGGPGPDDPVGDPSAEQLATEELELYDVDQNGSLSLEEMTAEFTSQGLSDAEAAEYATLLFETYDLDGNNELSHPELVASWGGPDSDINGETLPDGGDDGTGDGNTTNPPDVDNNSSEAEQMALAELSDYDTDGDGALSLQELTAELVDMNANPQEAAEMASQLLDAFDDDGDQQLSFDELVVSWGGSVNEDGDTGNSDASIVGDSNGPFDDDDLWADETDWWSTAFAIEF